MTLTGLITYFIIAFALLKIPVAGKYIAVFNTLIHETGHAVMATVTGGKADKIKLLMNTEGVAQTRNHWFERIFTTLAGYPAASITAMTYVWLLSINREDIILISLSVILLLSTICWVRNLYGLLWTGTVILLFTGLFWLIGADQTIWTHRIIALIAAVIAVESVKSAFQIMILAFRQPESSGDASNLARSLKVIPAQAWGILFFAQAVGFISTGIWLFIT